MDYCDLVLIPPLCWEKKRDGGRWRTTPRQSQILGTTQSLSIVVWNTSLLRDSSEARCSSEVAIVPHSEPHKELGDICKSMGIVVGSLSKDLGRHEIQLNSNSLIAYIQRENILVIAHESTI